MPAGRQRRELQEVCRVLAGGNAAEAIAALSELPEYWIPMLSAATSSTDAGHVLQEFLTESRQVDDLRHQWWLTLAYPVVLLSLATIVMLALSIFVVPEFGEIFDDFGLELPGLTKLIIATASALSSWTGVIVAVMLVALLLVVLYANRLLPGSWLAWFGDRLRLPFGRRATIARLARFLADLLESGVSLPDSLRIAGYCINRRRVRRAAWQLANEVETAEVSNRRVDQGHLSAAVTHVLTTDMTTAARVRLLREISDCNAERVRSGLSWASGLVEPFAICLVGFVIGIIVLGLYLPLVKLVEGLSG
jgi:type II secretory pathway component PulF